MNWGPFLVVFSVFFLLFTSSPFAFADDSGGAAADANIGPLDVRFVESNDVGAQVHCFWETWGILTPNGED